MLRTILTDVSEPSPLENAIAHMFDFEIAPEVWSSLIVILIILVLTIIVGIKARRADPLKRPKGILLLAEYGVNFFDNMVESMMGKRFRGFGGYVMIIAIYLFLSFIFGLTGLPAPTTYIAIPLSLGLFSFFMIHKTAVKYQKWGYFKRYIDPFPVFLPINLLSMWAPLLSLTLRLFGNAIAGWVLMSILYGALEALNGQIFSFLNWVIAEPSFFAGNYGGAILTPVVTAVLHLYFDLFSGFIQTTVFISLTMINIGQEQPSDVI